MSERIVLGEDERVTLLLLIDCEIVRASGAHAAHLIEVRRKMEGTDKRFVVEVVRGRGSTGWCAT